MCRADLAGRNSKEKQYFVIPCDESWRRYPPGLREFANDPAEQSADHAHRAAGVLLQRIWRNTSRTIRAPAVPHWIEKSESHDERLQQRAGGRVSAPVHVQPPALAHARPVRRHHLEPRGRNHEDPREGRLSIRAGVAAPAEAETRGIGTAISSRSSTSAASCWAAPMSPSGSGPKWPTWTTAPGGTPLSPGAGPRRRHQHHHAHNLTSKNATGMVVSGFLVEVAKVTGRGDGRLAAGLSRGLRPDYDAVAAGVCPMTAG